MRHFQIENKCFILRVSSFKMKLIYLCVIFLIYTICGGYSQILQNRPIKDALYLHNASISNLTLQDCSFRPTNGREICPDPDVRYILYNEGKRQQLDFTQSDWLRQSIWNQTKENIFIIHGYAGGDDTLPIVVLRDAYIRSGNYNVWMVDWGILTQPPCYRAAVHNLRAVAKCIGELLTLLRNQGLETEKVTCVGHSLGAHMCGLISKYVLFRLHRIIALDPARPLVPPGVRLSSADANAVHVLHTNAGHYGESGKAGHVDFCINGGKIQPFCETSGLDEQLCSHVWSICYLASSINEGLSKRAEPCSRRCPVGPRPGNRIGIPILMGQHTPLGASGSYCLRDTDVPYCPKHMGAPGDVRCCLTAPPIIQPTTESAFVNTVY